MTEGTKKIILWSVTIIVAAGLFFWWIESAQKRFESFRGEEFMEKLNFPKIEMPKIEIPKLEEIIKNAEETSTTTE